MRENQEELLIGAVPPIHEKALEQPEENADERVASRLRERVPFPRVAPLPPRTELLDRVKELILGRGGPPLIGLWGTAGVGKTTLLQMLWQDPKVQRQFDFPLWSELGFDADASLDTDRAKQHLREQLSSWASALSLPATDMPTVDQLSAAVQMHLQKRRVLILLDDAWSGDSIRPFRVGTKAVVTTRNRDLLDRLRLDHEMVEIPPMTLAEAQVMVRQVTGQGIEYNDPRLHELHERTDGLPQTLRLALSRLTELGWEQVLGFLREETSKLSLLEQAEGRSRVESNRASFALSYDRLGGTTAPFSRTGLCLPQLPSRPRPCRPCINREAWRRLNWSCAGWQTSAWSKPTQLASCSSRSPFGCLAKAPSLGT